MSTNITEQISSRFSRFAADIFTHLQ